MKKYIITIISVLLCCTPVHAKVESTVCTAENIKNEGLCWDEPGCGWNYDDVFCELCPAGQYNDGSASLRCLDCLKPSDANFRRTADEFNGMTHSKECPWTIQCPIGEYINPDKWASYNGKNGTISCEKCGRGYTTLTGSSQSWNGEELLVLDGWGEQTGDTTPCQKKKFKIEVYVQYTDTTDCTTKDIMYDDKTINYYQQTIEFDASIDLDDIKEQMMTNGASYHPDTDKYAYPSEGTFTLDPYNCTYSAATPYPTMTLKNDEFKPSDDIADWNTDCSFMMTIELIQQPVVTIYYCTAYPDDPTTIDHGMEIKDICNKETYDRCNPNAKKISDIKKYGTGEDFNVSGTCDSTYATQWEYYTAPPSGRDNNPTLIDIDKPIPEPSGSKEIYLIPHYEPCQDGTYNTGRNYCPDKCTPCDVGETSTTDHTACTPCTAGTYNNTPGGTCTKCADGYFSGTGATECSQCPDGFTPDPDATSWNDCYMNPTLDFIDNESSAKKLLLTAPNKVYYQGNL